MGLSLDSLMTIFNTPFYMLQRPFRGKSNEALTYAILHDPVIYPEDRCSSECMDFMQAVSFYFICILVDAIIDECLF
jgi:hypothetical protein